MTFTVRTTHTFNDPALENREFFTSEQAWLVVAMDYAITDAGLDEATQAADAAAMAEQYAPGEFVTAEGERISVVEQR